ncbi:hypothetical protein OAJ44_04630 [Chloroflexi bacterium]|nr:hypothetical protein [Chloroflexota bacterium]
MGILGFGKVTKLEDLNINDLKKERLTQEVKQDQLLTRLRQAQEQYDGFLEAASEPGLSDGEIDAAAYKMEMAGKTKTRTEFELQEIITKMTVIDSTVDILNQRQELEKKGIWKKINSIPEEQLEAQLEELAVDRKETAINLNNIVEMFDTSTQSVKANRSADFRRSRDAILERQREKQGD